MPLRGGVSRDDYYTFVRHAQQYKDAARAT
jgi:hypothetical protein